MGTIQQFKSLPLSTRRLLGVGMVLALTVALPLFVLSITTERFDIREKAQGEPNFCGGTCGSNYNCQSNFFCYIAEGKNSGYCRNPLCKEDSDCDCVTPVPSPTIKPKTTLKASAKPTPTTEVIYLTPVPTPSSTPRVTSIAMAKEFPTIIPTREPVETKTGNNLFLYLGGGFLGLALLLVIANTFAKK